MAEPRVKGDRACESSGGVGTAESQGRGNGSWGKEWGHCSKLLQIAGQKDERNLLYDVVEWLK